MPAHDERDFVFATKFNLPIERVIKAASTEEDDALPYINYGIVINSGPFDSLTSEEAKKAIIEKLATTNEGSFKINYRLRDWLVSRQRYWGAPIPIIHCPKCGTVPVPEKDLPVTLPYDVDFTPDGTSPLAKHEAFMHVKCPVCGEDAKRDADTLDTFVCSSWYFLRYPNHKNDAVAWDVEKTNRLLPVDKYVGGPEHACMHLLYARFFTMAFYDMGLLNFEEPFTSLVHQGIILGPDGERMSKSRGNVISPDSYVEKYGSDAFRMYLGFGFAYIEGGPWNDDGIKAVYKFLERVERLFERIQTPPKTFVQQKPDQALNYVLHNTIKSVTQDLETFSFNTAIARIMELTNALYKHTNEAFDPDYAKEVFCILTQLLSPFAPHFAEEMWERAGREYSIFNSTFPIYDEKALIKEEILYPLQINGKTRNKFLFSKYGSQEEIKAFVLSKFARYFEGKEVVKFIVVPGRIVNVVVK